METIRRLVEWVALAIELLAVVVIAASILVALWPRHGGAFAGFRRSIGRGLLLGLELLLAADIVATVALMPTLERLLSLGLLVLIRSFLSWSLSVEIEGCWPWRAKAERRVADEPAGRAREIPTQE